jgi:hypothetical protein
MDVLTRLRAGRAWVYGLVGPIGLMLAPTASRAGYSFSVSASDTDPGAVQANATQSHRRLYLWLICGDDPLSAFEAQVTGSLEVLSFMPLGGALNAGTETNLQLAIGSCPAESTVLGYWTVTDVGGTVCLAPPLTAVNCDPQPEAVSMPRVTGFSSSSAPPCEVGSAPCASGSQGLVIGYGELLEPPYEFSGAGGDTLYLNGLAYYPTRRPPPGPPLIPSPEVLARANAQSAVFDSALAAGAEFTDPTARIGAFAAVFTASALVDSVSVAPPYHAAVWWKDPAWGTNHYILRGAWDVPPASPPGARDDPTALHQALVEQFHGVTGRDGFILFGGGYFTAGGSASKTAAMRRALRALTAGGSIDERAAAGTPLEDDPVRADVLRRSEAMRHGDR